MMSVFPPAANGTTTVTVLVGQSVVCADEASGTNPASRTSPASTCRRPMVPVRVRERRHDPIMALGECGISKTPSIPASTPTNVQIINAMGEVLPSRGCLFAGIWGDQSVVIVRLICARSCRIEEPRRIRPIMELRCATGDIEPHDQIPAG
jgi:hypothetical protein